MKKSNIIENHKFQAIDENVEENSSMQKSLRENRPGAESGLVKMHCEDHLGVALIPPGGSRYEQMRWQEAPQSGEDCNKGGTA